MKLFQLSKLSLLLLILMSSVSMTFGQEADQFVEEVDPQAKALLDRINAKMDKHNALRVNFNMEILVPGQEADKQEGYLLQQGDMFVFDISSQAIVANRKAVYVYLKQENEIQINDPDFGEDGSLLSPAQMMRLYETEDFFYGITEVNDNITKIEFKPEDTFSDYSKLRLSIDTNTDEISMMEIFSKDGSRINLDVVDILLNPQISSTDFQFDVNAYPNAYVEDLRID